jgi:hypothetical protein
LASGCGRESAAGRLLTHPVQGLERYSELFAKLTAARGAIKVFCDVAARA